MKRPLFLVRHDPPAQPFYADADQQDEPVPDVPLLAALLAFAWSKRIWLLVAVGVLLVVGGALVEAGWRP